MDDLFIYWHASAADAAAAETALRQWQQDLARAAVGLQVQRWRRDEPERARCTFMEAYRARDGSPLCSELIERIVSDGARALAPWLQGERHPERFRRLA